ncbi:MAG: class I SAM-dependent methyltransferase [Spirochaetales bacterium]|nr:class I SAM-dependent methyltransferase [Spirochaetales bacterium]
MTSQQCPICDEKMKNTGLCGNTWKIVQCRTCSLAKTIVPEAGRHDDYYEKDYFSGVSGKDFFSDFMQDNDKKRFYNILQKLDFYKKDNARLLDIGCAMGDFLVLAREKGWRVHGIEKSSYAAQQARSRLNADVHCGDLSEDFFPSDYFDVVTLHHTLEHIEDPVRDLSVIYNWLNKEGVIFVEVPNFGSLESRIYRDQWEDLRPEQHVSHFSPRSLKKLLEKTGFHVLRVETRIIHPWHSHCVIDYLHMFTHLFMNHHKASAESGKKKTIAGNHKNHRSNLSGIVNSLSWLLFRPWTLIEEKLTLAKRLIAFARKL